MALGLVPRYLNVEIRERLEGRRELARAEVGQHLVGAVEQRVEVCAP